MSNNVVDWLLEKQNPAIRYRTLTDRLEVMRMVVLVALGFVFCRLEGVDDDKHTTRKRCVGLGTRSVAERLSLGHRLFRCPAVLPIGVLLTCWVLLKQVKGENFRRYLIMAVVTLMTGCLAQPLDSIPDSLLGVWHGDTTVRLPIVFVPEPDSDPTDDVVLPVALNLTIHDDGTVTGTVGDAQLVNCVLKQNRGELGRQLNLATDYIIMDGYLSGPIVPEDEESEKAFTLPFNIVDDRMIGTLFWVMEWKYPLPLLPHVELVKEQ